MATYILTDGETIELKPMFGNFFSASEMEGLVDGDFHIIHLGEKGALVINAAYYAIGYTKNEVASELAKGFIPDDMWIAGPALHVVSPEYDLDSEFPEG